MIDTEIDASVLTMRHPEGVTNILVVDDDKLSQAYLGELLDGMGEKLAASSGLEAYELLAKNDFAAVILDINLPLQDGFEIARQIRKSGRNKDVPILFMTAGFRTGENMIKGYELGAVDYLLKPILPEVLRSKLKIFIDLFEQRRKIQKQVVDLEVANARLEKKQIERERLIEELQLALTNIKTLRGLLPICASCKNVKDDKGYWQQVEQYVGEHSHAEFTHGICPECVKRLYPEYKPKRAV